MGSISPLPTEPVLASALIDVLSWAKRCEGSCTNLSARCEDPSIRFGGCSSFRFLTIIVDFVDAVLTLDTDELGLSADASSWASFHNGCAAALALHGGGIAVSR